MRVVSQSPEKMENNDKGQEHFSLQCSFTNAIDLNTQEARNKYLQDLLAKYFVVRAEFSMA